jgi:predicted RNase H-like HicB family nuclease
MRTFTVIRGVYSSLYIAKRTPMIQRVRQTNGNFTQFFADPQQDFDRLCRFAVIEAQVLPSRACTTNEGYEVDNKRPARQSGFFVGPGAALVWQKEAVFYTEAIKALIFSIVMNYRYIPVSRGSVKTYSFKVVLEPDGKVWATHCPALLSQGASTWGATREEALRNIEEVVRLVVESLIEHGEPVPEGPAGEVEVSDEPHVAITI